MAGTDDVKMDGGNMPEDNGLHSWVDLSLVFHKKYSLSNAKIVQRINMYTIYIYLNYIYIYLH